MPLRCLVVLIVFALCFPAEAQQPKKVPLIGYISGGSANPANMRGFRQGLDRLGYVDGKNITIDSRYGEGKLESLPEFAADFVRLKANVIVTGGTPATLAAKNATSDPHNLCVSCRSDWFGYGFQFCEARR